MLFLVVFAFGWLCNSVYSTYFSDATEPYDYGEIAGYIEKAESSEDSRTLKPFIDNLLGKNAEDVPSPQDWIKEEQIKVYNSKIVIELKDAEWASFTDTNSMDPLIDSTANAIEIVPNSAREIDVGDVISYESRYTDGIIIHRVVKKDKDENGTYFILKGDNNPYEDPEKVRFEQIQRVLVAVIY